jgi:hypothetical protein
VSSQKDDDRYHKKLGGNLAAAAFVSPFASNINSNNNNDTDIEIANDNVSGNTSEIASVIASDSDVIHNNNVNNDNENNINNNNNNIVASNNDIEHADNNDDVDDETAATQEPPMHAIDALLEGTMKAPAKVFKGFYLEPDVARVLDKLAKKQGKGVQSHLVNEALRMIFVSKGLM